MTFDVLLLTVFLGILVDRVIRRFFYDMAAKATKANRVHTAQTLAPFAAPCDVCGREWAACLSA